MCVCMSSCHLYISAVPALRLRIRETEVCEAVVAAAVHCPIQSLKSYKRDN